MKPLIEHPDNRGSATKGSTETMSTTERMNEGSEFILNNAEAWLQYAFRINVLNEDARDLESLRTAALQEALVVSYLRDAADYHSTTVVNHKNPDLPIHKLLFLLDIGFGVEVPEVQTAVEKIMENRDNNGVYKSLTNIPEHFGGNGRDTFGWCLCDAPLLLLALGKAGVDYQQHLQQGVEYLVSLYKTGGFPCTVSEEFGTFRGPGRKDDNCPYASLVMLKLLTSLPEYCDSEVVVGTAQGLLELWQNSYERHPYMFYMGTDFRKLKAPAIWYDLVSVSDALSRVDAVRDDARFREMIAIIESKQDEQGLFTPESVYKKTKGYDFGQKKVPSLYLTYLCYLILARAS